MPRTKKIVEREIGRALRKAANAATKKWSDAYMKNQETFLGVKTPAVVEIVKKIAASYDAAELNGVWERLIESRYFEEKVAGIVIYQIKMLKFSETTWRNDLKKIAALVNRNHVVWWATCDGISGRIVGKLIAKHGKSAAREVARWRSSKNIWLKRMSLVSFVGHARKGDAVFEGALQLILEIASDVVKSDQRFHQTGVGWVIREVYKGNPRVAEKFIDQHYDYFSREGLRYAIEKMPAMKRKKYLKRDK